jgi:hypothetical protein
MKQRPRERESFLYKEILGEVKIEARWFKLVTYSPGFG